MRRRREWAKPEPRQRCADFDLMVGVPSASPDVQHRYLWNLLRGHIIGRDPEQPALRVFIDSGYVGPTSVPRGIAATFASRRGPRPHRVKVLADENQPTVRCIWCGKVGRYVGKVDTNEVDRWENGVRVRDEVIHMTGTFEVANQVEWAL